MARLTRLCVPGWPHLVLQSGHNRQPVFQDDVDRQFFLELLQSAASTHGVAIHAYALIDGEVRLLATPASGDSLSRTMQAVGRRYGGHFNRRHGHTGSLWEGRFRATVIEPERHLLACMRYAEQAPAVDELGTGLGRRPWSSAAHHLGERVDPLVSDHLLYWSLGIPRLNARLHIETCCSRHSLQWKRQRFRMRSERAGLWVHRVSWPSWRAAHQGD